MSKFILALFASVVIAVTGTSGYNQNRFGSAVGNPSWIIEVSNEHNNLRIGGANENGKYTLVTFWDSADAESRVACGRYQAVISGNPAVKDMVDYACINFDESASLFSNIVRADGLDSSIQYHACGEVAGQLKERFGLDKGMGSMLVSPSGMVIAYNPTPDYLASL